MHLRSVNIEGLGCFFSDSQNTDSSNATVSSPVSLTLSVVGDCTLGTDETFDYDISLNAYYENTYDVYAIDETVFTIIKLQKKMELDQ